MHKVAFQNADISFRLPDKKGLKAFIPFLFQQEKKKNEQINYIFCTDDYLLNINRQYLQHDYYTDIITFDLSDTGSIAGEIYISIERVKDNAKQMDVPFETECLRVIFHGALHLCGYTDKTQTQQKKMRQKEDEYIERYLLGE